MSSFSYQAINETGATVSGAIEADSEAMAESLLAAKGYIPMGISASRAGARAGASTSFWTRIKEMTGKVDPKDLILFTKQFRSMLHAGIPLLRLMQVLEAQTENSTLKAVVVEMAQDIRHGTTLYESVNKHPKVFSSLYCSMVQAGEMSGSLPEVLQRLTYIIEHETKIKADIKSALQYPKIVVGALGVAFFVLLTFVIPKFAGLFKSAGIVLPLPTQIAVSLYEFLANYWYIIVGAVAGVIFGFRAWFKTTVGELFKDAFLLRMPLFGPLFNKAALSRFASIFAILQASGVPVLTSMSILAGTIGNAAISREFERVRERMAEGQGIAAPLADAKYFTPMVVDMVAIGEESGNIEDMLREVTVHYDDEVAYATKTLSEAIGPILIMGLAAVVGFFALAIFMPMWDMIKLVK